LVYRYRAAGKDREMSLGPFPELSLAEARAKHVAARKAVVVDKADPLADRRAAKAAAADRADTPTFGEAADAYLASHETGWKNPKHRDQWRMTLTKYCAAIRDTPIDQVDAKAVLKVLKPLWTNTPETASRLRARIEAVLASAQVAGHINPDRPNPARWKGWLAQMLPTEESRRAARPPRGHALRRPARLHGAARRDARRGRQGARLHDPDRRKVGRDPWRDMGRDRLRRSDVDRPGHADEDAEAARRATVRCSGRDPPRS
jgi:hypothetical protein